MSVGRCVTSDVIPKIINAQLDISDHESVTAKDRGQINFRPRAQREFYQILEHVPKKLLAFFDQDMLQLFDFERVLIDQMILFDQDAL